MFQDGKCWQQIINICHHDSVASENLQIIKSKYISIQVTSNLWLSVIRFLDIQSTFQHPAFFPCPYRLSLYTTLLSYSLIYIKLRGNWSTSSILLWTLKCGVMVSMSDFSSLPPLLECGFESRLGLGFLSFSMWNFLKPAVRGFLWVPWFPPLLNRLMVQPIKQS